jgi:hypothetical protein
MGGRGRVKKGGPTDIASSSHLTFFLTKIDLQDAYLFIPTHPEHTKFLKF